MAQTLGLFQICKVAMTSIAEIVSEDLRDKKMVPSWENEVMRHSFCSYLLAKEQNIGHHTCARFLHIHACC